MARSRIKGAMMVEEGEFEIVEGRVAVLRLPLGEAGEREYSQLHVNLNLTKGQALNLKRLRIGLDERGARLIEGRRVTSNADAVRYLLEMIGIEVTPEAE